MKYDIFVSTVHGEIRLVDVEKLEKMAAGEFSRKGLDGADQNLTGLRPPKYRGMRRMIKARSLEAPRPSMQEEEHDDDYRITRDLQDDQTPQDYDIEHKPTLLMVGHRRVRDLTAEPEDGGSGSTSSNELDRPLMEELEYSE